MCIKTSKKPPCKNKLKTNLLKVSVYKFFVIRFFIIVVLKIPFKTPMTLNDKQYQKRHRKTNYDPKN